VKEFLSHEGVPFREIDIREDRAGLEQLLEWGFRATPVTVIGEERIQGFDARRLRAALGGAQARG